MSSSKTLPAIAANRQTEPSRLAALIRGELDWIVMKCLEKDRSRRYETANSLARDVQRYLADEPIEARPPSAGYRLRKFVKRYKAPAAAAMIVAISLLAGAGISVWQMLRAQSAERMAQAALQESREENANREAVQKFLLEKVFAAGRPEGLGGGLGRDVSLRQAIDAAVPTVSDAFRGRPVVEAAVRHELGRTYLMLGEYLPAVEQLLRVKELRTEHLGPDHLDTLRALHTLGVVRTLQWSIPEAIGLLEESSRGFAARLGPEHRETLQSRTDLASAYERDRRPADAARLHEEVLAIKRRTLGAEDPDTLDSMNELASPYRSLGRLPEAIALLEEVVRVLQARHGADHAETIPSHSHLAVMYMSAGRSREAITIFEAIVPISRRKLGPVHPQTSNMMGNWAVAYFFEERFNDEVRVRQEMLNDREKVHKADHMDMLSARNDLAEAFAHAGRWPDAIRLHEENLRLTRGVKGVQHPDAMASVLRLATAEWMDKRASDARTHWQEFLTWHQSVQNPHFADHLLTAGQTLLVGSLFVEAEVILRQALALRENNNSDTALTSVIRSLLGGALAGQMRFDEAELLLSTGYEGLRRHSDSIPLRYRSTPVDTLDRLVKLADATGQAEAAARWKAERDSLAK